LVHGPDQTSLTALVAVYRSEEKEWFAIQPQSGTLSTDINGQVVITDTEITPVCDEAYSGDQLSCWNPSDDDACDRCRKFKHERAGDVVHPRLTRGATRLPLDAG